MANKGIICKKSIYCDGMRGEKHSMKLKQKFLVMVSITSVVLVVVATMGYFYAKDQVTENIQTEMYSVVNTHSNQLDSWLLVEAKTAAVAAQDIETVVGDDKPIPLSFMQIYKPDSNLMDLYVGLEDGVFVEGAETTLPPGYDARKRGWYMKAKEKNTSIFTDAYIDAFTKKYIVTAATPVKNKAGNLKGVVGIDISLGILSERIKDVSYKGKGTGFIFDQNGIILANTDATQVSTNINDNAVFKSFAKELVTKDHGMQTYEDNGVSKILIYTKMPSTGWFMAITVDEKDVYGQVTALGYKFGLITLFGILISIAVSWVLVSKITSNVGILTEQAKRVARGDLKVAEIRIESSDEIGELAIAISHMAGNLRGLIHDIAQTSEQVAASSEELTAGAEQSAHASIQVSTSIAQVADGTGKQLQAISDTSVAVEDMYKSIQLVVGNAQTVASTAEKTASAAGEGSKAVVLAVNQMNVIERTVSSSAEVVSKLGERSKKIGQIVDAISSIAGQTNLLALNAAIEAARAGEQGRGFAVVAEEVRKLAEQSQHAAKQIAEMINEIQVDTATAVAAMNNGTREVNIGGEVVNKAGKSFGQIEGLVEQVSKQVSEITSSIQTMNIGSQKIVTAVQEIDRVTRVASSETLSISAATQEQTASMEEIASSSHALANMAEELQKSINKFSL